MPKPDESVPVGLVMLAAGASTRMGKPKQLLELNGESLLRRATLAALRSVCQPVVIVLGANEAFIRPETARLPVHVVVNTDWEQGMGSSIRTGIRQLLAAHPPVRAAVLMLCDQPLVNTALINQLVDCYRTSRLPVVACEYNDQLGVPALFDRQLFDELLQLDGAAGAKRLIGKYEPTCYRLPFPEGALDVDTPEDYEKVINRLGSGSFQ
jgi:molybdenum cofactor cytidylyltransferase